MICLLFLLQKKNTLPHIKKRIRWCPVNLVTMTITDYETFTDDDDDAIQLLVKVNAPSTSSYASTPIPFTDKHKHNFLTTSSSKRPFSRAGSSRPGSSRTISRIGSSRTPSRARSHRNGISPTSAAWSKPRLVSNRDDEAVKTHQYWQKWAKEATKALLAGTKEEKPEPEPIYTGHCGREPKFRRSNSLESIETNISLLTCSSLNQGAAKKIVRRKKKRKNVVPQREIKTDWEIFAKARTGGMLDKLIRRDNAKLEGMGHGVTGKSAIELMTEEERHLLLSTGYSKGLLLTSTRQKSHSTANVLAILPPDDREKLSYNGNDSRSSTATPGSDFQRRNLQKKVAAARAVSPKVIGRQVKAMPRPESAIPIITDSARSTMQRSFSILDNAHNLDYDQLAPRTYQAGLLGVPDYEQHGQVSRKVKQEINATLYSLNKMTGYGDPTDVGSNITHSDKLYTSADFAKFPVYPQNVRIAPHLSKIIREDILERMGRSRSQGIRTHDIRLFEMEHPGLGRSYRNLMIFNWLSSIDDDNMDIKSEADIYDIEGTKPNDRYPLCIPGAIIGEERGNDDDDEEEEEDDDVEEGYTEDDLKTEDAESSFAENNLGYS